MIDIRTNSVNWNPGRAFYFGLAIVLLATWIPFIPAWPTFIHMWRVDLAASVFLLFTLGYLLVRGQVTLPISISHDEKRFIVFPVVAFIVWSALSILWAPSWKSAAHHTSIWAEYLIFYLLVRYLVDEERHFGKLLVVFSAVMVLFAVPALVEFVGLTLFGGETFFRGRYAKYGEQIVTLLPLILFALMRLSGRKFYAGLGAVSLLWLLIYCSAGRVNIALFATALASVAAVVFFVRRFHVYRSKFAVCALMLALVPVPFFLLSLVAAAPDISILGRLNDTSGSAYSKDFRILMNSVSLEMIRTKPMTGVGADNYGLQFNAYREQYAASQSDDPNLFYGEMGIVGHAHNEYLQIAAELGIVGVLIFAWFLCGIALMAVRAARGLGRRSPFAFAAIVGLVMFLASSAVSSYSFRLMQNGLVFFFVLAVAAKATLGVRRQASALEASTVIRQPRLAIAFGMLACVALALYSSVRVGSVILATRANYTHDLTEAERLYRLGMMLDDENPDVRNNLASRYFQEGRFADAVPLFEESIRIGRAQSVDFSYLASSQSLAGDNQGGERTMAAAARLYPRSAFILTRHAVFLDLNGKTVESRIKFEKALAIDRPSANTWWAMITKGSQAATNLAFKSSDYKPVMDLQPQPSMYAVLEERYVRFPDEQLLFRRR